MNTSQPNHNSDGSDDLDTLLGAAYTHLVELPDRHPRPQRRAAQATHLATYSALTSDLAQQLDLDAGLRHHRHRRICYHDPTTPSRTSQYLNPTRLRN